MLETDMVVCGRMFTRAKQCCNASAPLPNTVISTVKWLHRYLLPELADFKHFVVFILYCFKKSHTTQILTPKLMQPRWPLIDPGSHGVALGNLSMALGCLWLNLVYSAESSARKLFRADIRGPSSYNEQLVYYHKWNLLCSQKGHCSLYCTVWLRTSIDQHVLCGQTFSSSHDFKVSTLSVTPAECFHTLSSARTRVSALDSYLFHPYLARSSRALRHGLRAWCNWPSLSICKFSSDCTVYSTEVAGQMQPLITPRSVESERKLRISLQQSNVAYATLLPWVVQMEFRIDMKPESIWNENKESRRVARHGSISKFYCNSVILHGFWSGRWSPHESHWRSFVAVSVSFLPWYNFRDLSLANDVFLRCHRTVTCFFRPRCVWEKMRLQEKKLQQ